MSKNFRSSFIDLLCCRYSKRNLFGVNESLRGRRITNNNNRSSLYFKSDYMVRTSVVSRFSQLTPMTTVIGATTSSSISRLATELSPMFIPNDERKMSNENNRSCHNAVKLSEPYRRRTQSDRSTVEPYCSFVTKTTEVLCA
jgi:hypothetical protein